MNKDRSRYKHIVISSPSGRRFGSILGYLWDKTDHRKR